MEKEIMSKSNDTERTRGRKIMSKRASHGAAATSERELTVDELDAVVGGTTAYVPYTYAIGRIEARFPRLT
jgi:hypothetical protein